MRARDATVLLLLVLLLTSPILQYRMNQNNGGEARERKDSTYILGLGDFHSIHGAFITSIINVQGFIGKTKDNFC